MHLAPLIRDLAIILGVAAVVTFLFRRIRQPVVLGYIIAGIIVGPYTPQILSITDVPNVQVWAELGIVFLMFTLGLEFSFRKLGKVGVTSGLAGAIELSFMVFLGFRCGRMMGWSPTESAFLGCMVSISSTTIIAKTLDELQLKARSFAETIFGVLIVEDLAAILMLVALSSVAINHSFGGMELAGAAVKLFFVVSVWVLVGLIAVPRLVRSVGRIGNEEMLTVLSLGLCLSLVAISASLNYSVALGAFIMGSILAESGESHRIEQLMRPLRDTFGAVFFVTVGMLIDPRVLVEHWSTILIVSLTVVGGKVVGLTFASLAIGRRLVDAVRIGFTMTQIGEFSFILATVGQASGLVEPSLYPIIVAVSLVTTFTTPYMVRASDPAAVWVSRRLPPRVRQTLDAYHGWLERWRAESANGGPQLGQPAARWSVCAIIVITIFTVAGGFVLPHLRGLIHNRTAASLAVWAGAMTVSAPFIWSMLAAFRRHAPGADAAGLPWQTVVLASRLLTILCVGFLSMEFFVTWIALLLTALALLAFYRLFPRQLSEAYRRLESDFRANIGQHAAGDSDLPHHLAPWDARLVQLRVHPDAQLAGRRLGETDLRTVHGVNVVAIQRGSRVIVAPPANEVIQASDTMLVLGPDEAIAAVRAAIEEAAQLVEQPADALHRYRLRNLTVRPDSPLIGRSIRDARIREELDLLVVGIERGRERLLTPPPEFVLASGDRLWVVGEAADAQLLETLGSVAPVSLQDA